MSGEGLLLVYYGLQFLRRMRKLPVICLAPSCFCPPPSMLQLSSIMQACFLYAIVFYKFLRRMRTLPCYALHLSSSFNAISRLSASIKITLNNGIAYQRLEIITSFLYAIAFCSHPIIQQPDLTRQLQTFSRTLTLLHINAMAPKLTDGTNTLTLS